MRKETISSKPTRSFHLFLTYLLAANRGLDLVERIWEHETDRQPLKRSSNFSFCSRLTPQMPQHLRGSTDEVAAAARFRAVASRMRLRSRSDFGVASTYSSTSMYSMARSRLIRNGASNCTPLPSPCDLMFVTRFARHGLTGKSSGRAFSPTIIPA